MKKTFSRLLLILLVMVVLSQPTSAYDSLQRVKFAPGTSGTMIESTVSSSNRIVYLLGARAGQKMVIGLSSENRNHVLQVYDPRKKLMPGNYPNNGSTMWSGRLPVSGDYRITVGSSWGRANFDLMVMIK